MSAISTASAANDIISASIAHARSMLLSQRPMVAAQRHDFLPAFEAMTTQMYMADTMWRFGEQFDAPTNARDRGLIYLMAILVEDGMSEREAQQRIAYLNGLSRGEDGRDTLRSRLVIKRPRAMARWRTCLTSSRVQKRSPALPIADSTCPRRLQPMRRAKFFS